ncbi:hypothetical protein IC582_001919 [Cucumis melo]
MENASITNINKLYVFSNLIMTSATLNMLAADKLNGNNYASWKNIINTVLIIDDLRFVLVEECPQVPAANATRTVREPYECWAKANEKARAYILASLSEVLAKKHESMLTAREIMDSLQEMFGQASYQIKHDALKYIYNARMNEGASVREHVLNMMVHFNVAEMNGVVIDEASQVSFILESLPESFLQFRSNAVMNKIAYTLTTLLNELQTFESLMKIKGQKGEANVATSTRKFHRGSTSGTKSMPSSSGNKKWKKKKGGQGNKANLAAAKTTKKAKAAKGICFHCNQEGHWKRNCPKYLAEKKKAKQGKYDLLVLETCLVENDDSAWIIDSGATNHVCSSFQGISSWRQLETGEMTMRVGTGHVVSAIAVGGLQLCLQKSFLLLENVYVVPDLKRNLISVKCLLEQSYSLTFNVNKVFIYKNGVEICSAKLENNLYVLRSLTSKALLNTEMFKTAITQNKRLKISPKENAHLWHLRLGHINLNRIERLVKNGLLSELEENSLPVCESCLEGKMTKRPFTGKGHRAKEPLELVHSDLCGPMNVKARGGFEYFITFTDDYSRYGYVYLMQHKSEALEKFKEYKAEVENALSKTIKTFRSDRGGEYMDLKFQNYLMECGIVSQLSAPGTPQQNGVSERRNRTLLDMVRSMMSYAHLPNSFWGYAVQTAVYILNCVPSKSVSETPLKLWYGRKGSLRHFRIWGCPAHVLENNPKKLEPRSKLCLFVGYPKGTRGGYFYDPKDNKVFVSTNATFLEEDHIREHKPRSKIVLNELSKETTEPSTRVVEEPSALTRVVHVGSSTRTHQPQSLREPRRSGRVTNLPIRYMSLTETLTVISDGDIEDPLTFKKAMEDVDKDEWIKAMNLELESMYFNSVWDLVDQPDGVKPIGCKWIYKRKRGADGKVQTFKARLVAKGYTQVEGVDYEETFSPVAMLKSIRILLSIAAYFDYEIWQMDVKTAFLNGNLEETIYMQQPEGFIIPGQEQKICKLNRSIYGLKQASRSWNIRFDTAIKSYGFDQIVDEPCVYKRIINKSVAFLVFYVDDILLIGNDIGLLTDIKQWLATQFQMKDLGEAQFVLGIQIFRDRKNKMLALSQASYIDKIVVKYSMQKSKRGLLPFRHGVTLSKEQCPKTPQDVEEMRHIPYASAVGSLMYAMLCTRPDICYAVGIVSRYQSNPGLAHWTAVKTILKYLRRTRDYTLVYGSKDLILTGYTDSDFQTDRDSRKSTSGSVFTLNGGAVVWRSIKQGCIADSTMEAEYVAACEAAKEAVWLRNFLIDLEVVPNMSKPITLYCDNSGDVANSREPRSHKHGKHIERKYHLIREIVHRGDVIVTQIASTHNVADPFTKPLTAKVFEGHLESLGLRDMPHLT